MPNDRNYENYAVASGESLYAVLLKEANTTSRNIVCYTGYYMGGTPVILDPKPFDLARDLSTGNLWQYTGSAWVAPSWQTSITIWLGGATTVCERLKAPDTKIPDTVTVYYGTDDAVPPELALSADDLVIKHDVGNYNLEANVMRRDVTTNTMVDVPFPEGYIATTDDGDWTVLKNFTQCVGYDYAMVSLAWTTTADGVGPQSVDYVTSNVAELIASDIVSGALVDYPTSGAVVDMIDSAIGSGGDLSNYVTSSGVSAIASNIAVTTLLSGGQAAVGDVSAIELWFESGYRENIYADFVMSSKSLTLVSSGGSFVYRPDNYLWVSTGIDGYGDISNTLNAPEVSAGFFATSSGGAIVVSAVGVTESFLEGPADSTVIDGLIASSTDGGRTWTFGDAGIYWGTNGEEVDGEGWCYPVWGIGRCCGAELLQGTLSASGALLSNTEIDTTIGDYRITATSGGVVVSGTGASVVLSGGKIEMRNLGGCGVIADSDGNLVLNGGDVLGINAEHVLIGGNITVELAANSVTVNSRSVATQLVTSTITDSSTAFIAVLSGGTSLTYSTPLYQMDISHVVKTTEASFIHFTLDSEPAPTPVVISGYTFDSGRFEAGKEYLVGFFDGMCAVNEVTSGGILQ